MVLAANRIEAFFPRLACVLPIGETHRTSRRIKLTTGRTERRHGIVISLVLDGQAGVNIMPRRSRPQTGRALGSERKRITFERSVNLTLRMSFDEMNSECNTKTGSSEDVGREWRHEGFRERMIGQARGGPESTIGTDLLRESIERGISRE